MQQSMYSPRPHSSYTLPATAPIPSGHSHTPVLPSHPLTSHGEPHQSSLLPAEGVPAPPDDPVQSEYERFMAEMNKDALAGQGPSV